MSKEAHLGGGVPQGDSNTWMPDIWGYLAVKYELKMVLDVGCGYGYTMKWFAENCLCVVTGIDGDEDTKAKAVCNPDNIVVHDFTKGPAPVGTPHDLAWSAEFVEHVAPACIPHFMAAFNLCRHAVITHGEPGQYGHHHVNCQPSSYWIACFESYGWKHDPDETLLLRRTDRWRAGWGRRSLLSFHKL